MLAVVPIVMAAMDMEIKSLKPALRQKAKDKRVAEIYQSLNNELALLKACLRHPVENLASLSDIQRQALLDLDMAAWSSADVNEALKVRFGDTHESFFDTVTTIATLLDSIISNRTLDLVREDTLVSIVRSGAIFTTLMTGTDPAACASTVWKAPASARRMRESCRKLCHTRKIHHEGGKAVEESQKTYREQHLTQAPGGQRGCSTRCCHSTESCNTTSAFKKGLRGCSQHLRFASIAPGLQLRGTARSKALRQRSVQSWAGKCSD